MAVKVLLGYVFNDTGPKRPGFSEVHFYDAAPSNLRDAALNTAVVSLYNARTQLMGQNVRPSLYRLSSPGRKLRSYTVYAEKNGITNAGIVQQPSLNQGGADIPNTSLQLTISTALAQVRQTYMAGLPDLVFSTGAVVGPDFSAAGLQTYQALWNGWKALLLNGKWGSVFLNVLPAGQPQAIAYWLRSDIAPSNIQFVLPNTATYQPNVGDTVHVRGVLMFTSGTPRPNGNWKILSKTAIDANNTGYELQNSSAYEPTLVDQPGTVESVTKGFQPYFSFDNGQQTSRKRGIGPARPRGRSRPRQRRQPS